MIISSKTVTCFLWMATFASHLRFLPCFAFWWHLIWYNDAVRVTQLRPEKGPNIYHCGIVFSCTKLVKIKTLSNLDWTNFAHTAPNQTCERKWDLSFWMPRLAPTGFGHGLEFIPPGSTPTLYGDPWMALKGAQHLLQGRAERPKLAPHQLGQGWAAAHALLYREAAKQKFLTSRLRS